MEINSKNGERPSELVKVVGLFTTDWHEFSDVIIGGERKDDSVSCRGWKICACGFLKRIGPVQPRAQIDGGATVEKDDGSPERTAFRKFDPNSGGGCLTDTRPRLIMRQEGVACDFATPEIGGWEGCGALPF